MCVDVLRNWKFRIVLIPSFEEYIKNNSRYNDHLENLRYQQQWSALFQNALLPETFHKTLDHLLGHGCLKTDLPEGFLDNSGVKYILLDLIGFLFSNILFFHGWCESKQMSKEFETSSREEFQQDRLRDVGSSTSEGKVAYDYVKDVLKHNFVFKKAFEEMLVSRHEPLCVEFNRQMARKSSHSRESVWPRKGDRTPLRCSKSVSLGRMSRHTRESSPPRRSRSTSFLGNGTFKYLVGPSRFPKNDSFQTMHRCTDNFYLANTTLLLCLGISKEFCQLYWKDYNLSSSLVSVRPTHVLPAYSMKKTPLDIQGKEIYSRFSRKTAYLRFNKIAERIMPPFQANLFDSSKSSSHRLGLDEGHFMAPDESWTQDYSYWNTSLGYVMGTRSCIILISGGSGCGKSTLALSVGKQIGSFRVVSTDTLRHVLRSKYSQQDNPILYSSTYNVDQALTQLDPQHYSLWKNTMSQFSWPISSDSLCVKGYILQSRMLYEAIELVIQDSLEMRESLILEGIHLTGEILKLLQKRFPGQCINFFIYLKQHTVHVQRLANRSLQREATTISNDYIQHIDNIYEIQNFLLNNLPSFVIPLENTCLSASKEFIRQHLLATLHPHHSSTLREL